MNTSQLSSEKHRALTMLAYAGPRGCSEEIFLASSFKRHLLGDLIRHGLATVHEENTRGAFSQRTVTRIRITDAGRRAVGVLY